MLSKKALVSTLAVMSMSTASFAGFIAPSRAQFLPTSGPFYDFGNIFNGGWSGGSAAIFGGQTLGDLISSTIGGSSLGGILGGLGSSGVFDQVFGHVSDRLGLPPELLGVIHGQTSPREIIDGILGPIMDTAGLDLDGLLGDILGASGIPDLEPLLDELYGVTESEAQAIYGHTPTAADVLGTPPEHAAANVNTALVRPIQALDALTSAVTTVGLSLEGQEITEARRQAGFTAVGASEEMGGLSSVLSGEQIQAAAALSPAIQGQTSTQRTLKTALAGMNEMHAQATQFYALANEQTALGLQLQKLQLEAAFENRDGNFAIATGLQRLNESVFAQRQVELSEASSTRIQMSVPLKTMGAMR